MIFPIIAYGHPVLRKRAEEVSIDHPDLKQFIADLFETMYHAHGVGLAAPQVGKSIRVFIVDGTPMDGSLKDDPQPMKGWKKAFINPEIIEEEGEEWGFEEGCLSIPDIRDEVYRQEKVKVRYFDENFKEHLDTFTGLKARIIQHEYDHLEGVLFTDHLSGFRKQLLKTRLLRISKGKVDPDYEMIFPRK